MPIADAILGDNKSHFFAPFITDLRQNRAQVLVNQKENRAWKSLYANLPKK